MKIVMLLTVCLASGCSTITTQADVPSFCEVWGNKPEYNDLSVIYEGYVESDGRHMFVLMSDDCPQKGLLLHYNDPLMEGWDFAEREILVNRDSEKRTYVVVSGRIEFEPLYRTNILIPSRIEVVGSTLVP